MKSLHISKQDLQCLEGLEEFFHGRGEEYSFTLAIWVCAVAPKSTVFQSNLCCKTIIRFSPSFRKNIQHFLLISLLDLTLHTETNDDH